MKSLLIIFLIPFAAYSQSSEIKYNSSKMKGIDFSTFHTYAWLPYVDSITINGYDKDKLNTYISSEIDTELTDRGLTQVQDNGNPDVLVRYSIMLNRREGTKTENVYGKPNVGVGMGFGSGGYRGMSIGVSSPDVVGVKTITILIKEGALIVDMIDVKSNQIVWWGAAEKSKEDKGELANAKMVIEEVIPKIFKKLPMKKVKKKK